MTIRGDAEVIIDEHSGLTESGYPRCVVCELDGPCLVVRRARSIIDTLDHSREVTEKTTNAFLHVTNHKARIVFDD